MLGMAKPSTQKKIAGRQPAQREFIVGGVGKCPYPGSEIAYLGHHGPTAFWQYQPCEAVIISIPEDNLQQMNKIPSEEEL